MALPLLFFNYRQRIDIATVLHVDHVLDVLVQYDLVLAGEL